ncbi:MAG: molybdopterin molybdotransferase MoeA [Campylobacteraceae bacterium]|nr:molybdopterin molybdotransferase MoeA [Campylobacteraceae bacterium]
MSISYQKALEIIQTTIKPLHVKQKLPLLKTLGRIASEDVFARCALPKTSISLKEGYGIHTLFQAKNYTIVSSDIRFIPAGHALKLTTGQTLVEGINAVIADEEIDCLHHHTLILSENPPNGHHIKQKGEDIKVGELILKKGECISAHKITPIAAQGISKLTVFSKPKIGILSIGNNIRSLACDNRENTIYNSNAMSLGARVIELGGEVVMMGECKENEKSILIKLHALSQKVDFIITSGAMSAHDAMNLSLEKSIFQTLFHHVLISPAKPSALSLLNNIPILHLTGFPLSCMLGFEMLGAPILRALQSLPLLPKPTLLYNQKVLTCKASCTSAIPGLREGNQFISAPSYQAGMLNVLGTCNGYILGEGKEIIKEGECVSFFPFTHPPVS